MERCCIINILKLPTLEWNTGASATGLSDHSPPNTTGRFHNAQVIAGAQAMRCPSPVAACHKYGANPSRQEANGSQRRQPLISDDCEGSRLKHILKLILLAIWLSAPVVSLLMMHHLPSGVGSYPFYGILCWAYGSLHKSTDLEFVLIILGMAVFWTVLGAACLLIGRHRLIKYFLIAIALADIGSVLLQKANVLTIGMDLLFIGIALASEREQHRSARTNLNNSRLDLNTADKPLD